MKVPTPRKLKSGNYFIQLRLGGVSVPVTAPTAKECTRQAELIKAEYRSNKRTIAVKEPSTPTLQSVIEDYIAKYEPVLSPSTVRGYEQIKANRFSAFMDKKVSDIDWQDMVNAELRTVGPKTVKNAWGLVRSSLTDRKLPAPEIKLPQVPVKEIPFLQPEEIIPFCGAIKGDMAEIAVLLELQGLRRSEVKGLDWENIDLKNKKIKIRGARVQNKDGQFVHKETNKNVTSTRTVPIMIPQLLEALTAVKDKTGPVVLISTSTMLKHTNNACKAAGVTIVGNHGLRHSFASLGYHLGLSERQLMDLGGWADYMTMHKIYIRLAEADKRAANNAVFDFFKNANENANAV